VPAERIAQNLAFINWTVLIGLAAGSAAVVVIGRLRTEATRGYLAFTAFCALLFGVLAWASDGALPASLGASPVVADAAWDAPRRVALAIFCVFTALLTVAVARRSRAQILGIATLGAGFAVLALAALSWGGDALGVAALLVQLVALSAATGGVFAAMVLGHWYLVTPKLPEAPLVLFSRLLLAILACQVVLFAAWLGFGIGPGASAGFADLFGQNALFVWLRLIVGLLFPLVVSWAAVQTARTRSMESATGLLYINVGTIAAGTILAAGLYFGSGLLV
jgi:hypothetical protein